MNQQPMWAIGLMSGTSLDGVDAALIRTDGHVIHERGPWLTVPYDTKFQEVLGLAVQQMGDIAAVARDLTEHHGHAVKTLLKQADMKPQEVSVIGFHGQTIDHRPDEGITWQIGDGSLLSSMTGIDVVCDFRRKDVAEGGHGAPLVPVYHAALAHDLPKPLVVLNIGGIANVTWIDEENSEPWMMAFDTGPGNAMLNDLMLRRIGEPCDRDGAHAMKGTPDRMALDGYFLDEYFDAPPPKSLDRDEFRLEPVSHLNTDDAAATLMRFTVESIAKAAQFFPKPARQWLVAGGGRHNKAIMQGLKELLGEVNPVEAVGWEGDALEAQAFAYLAVRSRLRLPFTLPQITGARRPTSGGAFYPA